VKRGDWAMQHAAGYVESSDMNFHEKIFSNKQK